MLILIHGLPLSLKSTMGIDFAARFQCGLVSTGFFGTPMYSGTDEEFHISREVRYNACKTIGLEYLKNGWPVILEGNFSLPKWRKWIFDYAADKSSSFVTIRCVCSDVSARQSRYNTRYQSLYGLDREGRSSAYEQEQSVEVPISSKEYGPLLDFLELEIDTGTWRLSVKRNISSKNMKVLEELERWSAYRRVNKA